MFLLNFVPAMELEIEAQFQWVLSIDPTLNKERLSQKDLQNAVSLQSFMKAHCHLSAYAFQVKNVVIMHVTTAQNIQSGLILKALRAYIFYHCHFFIPQIRTIIAPCVVVHVTAVATAAAKE